MAPIPPMRQTETGSTDVEPAAVLRGAAPVRTAAVIAAAAAVFLAVVVLAGIGKLDSTVPVFLSQALGPEEADAPMERTPATGVGVRIHDQGYTVSHWGVSLSVVSEDVGGEQWRRHVHGVTREVTFDLQAFVSGGKITATGAIPILFSDYEIQDPSLGPVSTEDNGLLEFLLVMAKA